MSENDLLGKLTEESLKRKERLKQLKEKANKHGNDPDSHDNAAKPVFRSYKPQNVSTVGEIIPKKPTGDIEEAVGDQLNLLKQSMALDDIDMTNLAPRKPDWDLKRDVGKKMAILERRTQKAIAELIRERLKKNQEGHEIFQAVNIATAHAR
ncbi:coiled-coil domain-containing protein 12 [Haematobia irritans]|uniref:coiled-coil domain-containing protein 12 n=1 Tax=Haematobia irritans TaxID=7368 RepID=UPI003F5098EC